MATGGGAEEERKRGRPQLLGPARPSTRAEEAEGGREKMGWAQVVKNLAEKKWQCNHIVAGTIFIIYDQQRTDISARISDIQIRHQNLVLSSQQHYINEGTCLHVCTIMGEARLLTALADEMTSIKGIRHGKLLMSRAD